MTGNTTCVPQVGVAVPVYNGENYIEEAIESILSQSFEDLELIISDDGSTDRTEDTERRHRRIADTSRVVVFAVEKTPDGSSGASPR